ncbi:unnamed protein product [Vitrella brassicaformis CCMP3155]|uniref:C3H1-type domain-containing protein n=1 Tax=Vitrella brassicaformis (strain CCMP3155) TaxID=1169540 RepID=A0A0G4GE42_VITBC|nr:unnamed protein product [Vitrella brassicaformis CCMP3155]|eukprot:CEM27668.1 unnamed protein product [Vitrella brassicaformis CCMP3155]
MFYGRPCQWVHHNRRTFDHRGHRGRGRARGRGRGEGHCGQWLPKREATVPAPHHPQPQEGILDIPPSDVSDLSPSLVQKGLVKNTFISFQDSSAIVARDVSGAARRALSDQTDSPSAVPPGFEALSPNRYVNSGQSHAGADDESTPEWFTPPKRNHQGPYSFSGVGLDGSLRRSSSLCEIGQAPPVSILRFNSQPLEVDAAARAADEPFEGLGDGRGGPVGEETRYRVRVSFDDGSVERAVADIGVFVDRSRSKSMNMADPRADQAAPGYRSASINDGDTSLSSIRMENRRASQIHSLLYKPTPATPSPSTSRAPTPDRPEGANEVETQAQPRRSIHFPPTSPANYSPFRHFLAVPGMEPMYQGRSRADTPEQGVERASCVASDGFDATESSAWRDEDSMVSGQFGGARSSVFSMLGTSSMLRECFDLPRMSVEASPGPSPPSRRSQAQNALTAENYTPWRQPAPPIPETSQLFPSPYGPIVPPPPMAPPNPLTAPPASSSLLAAPKQQPSVAPPQQQQQHSMPIILQPPIRTQPQILPVPQERVRTGRAPLRSAPHVRQDEVYRKNPAVAHSFSANNLWHDSDERVHPQQVGRGVFGAVGEPTRGGGLVRGWGPPAMRGGMRSVSMNLPPEWDFDADEMEMGERSLGSVDHPRGCRPCMFYWSPKGCMNGLECPYCHMYHPNKKRKPVKEQRNLMIIARPDGKVEYIRCSLEEALRT